MRDRTPPFPGDPGSCEPGVDGRQFVDWRIFRLFCNMRFVMNVLVVDVGGNNVKILAPGQDEPRKLPSGPTFTPELMVSGVKKLAGDWTYEVVSIGYPGPIRQGRPGAEPHNLGPGWVGFDYEAAFGRPVKLINDAA